MCWGSWSTTVLAGQVPGAADHCAVKDSLMIPQRDQDLRGVWAETVSGCKETHSRRIQVSTAVPSHPQASSPPTGSYCHSFEVLSDPEDITDPWMMCLGSGMKSCTVPSPFTTVPLGQPFRLPVGRDHCCGSLSRGLLPLPWPHTHCTLAAVLLFGHPKDKVSI